MIEHLIRQRLIAEHQCDRIGSLIHLLFEQLLNQPIDGERPLGVVPVGNSSNISGRHRRQQQDLTVRIINDCLQHLGEELLHTADSVGVETGLVVGQFAANLRIEVRQKGERKVGLIVEVEVPIGKCRPGSSDLRAGMLRNNHHDRLECCCAAIGKRRLDVGQRGVLEGALVGLLPPDIAHIVEHYLRRVDDQPNGRRVDEQSNDVVAIR